MFRAGHLKVPTDTAVFVWYAISLSFHRYTYSSHVWQQLYEFSPWSVFVKLLENGNLPVNCQSPCTMLTSFVRGRSIYNGISDLSEIDFGNRNARMLVCEWMKRSYFDTEETWQNGECALSYIQLASTVLHNIQYCYIDTCVFYAGHLTLRLLVYMYVHVLVPACLAQNYIGFTPGCKHLHELNFVVILGQFTIELLMTPLWLIPQTC